MNLLSFSIHHDFKCFWRGKYVYTKKNDYVLGAVQNDKC